MIVGFVEDAARVDALRAALDGCSVPFTRDRIPHGPRYRVFVRGTDIGRARAGAPALVTAWPSV